MEKRVQAGIDLYEATLRYAEVERTGEAYRLLRLGSCDFDFDVTEEVLYNADPTRLETLGEALADVLEESAASELHVVVHPPHGYSFFTPMAVDLPAEERDERFRQEVAWLTGAGARDPLHLTVDAVYAESDPDGAPLEWYHVLGMREAVHARFHRLTSMLPTTHYRLNLSMQGAASTAEYLARRGDIHDSQGPDAPPYTLLVGLYTSHFEYTLCRGHRWHFSHYTDAGPPVDCAYYAMQLLNQFKLARTDVGAIFLYGPRVDPDQYGVLEDVFRVKPRKLNPIPIMNLEPDSLGASFAAEAYVPCIGVAL